MSHPAIETLLVARDIREQACQLRDDDPRVDHLLDAYRATLLQLDIDFAHRPLTSDEAEDRPNYKARSGKLERFRRQNPNATWDETLRFLYPEEGINQLAIREHPFFSLIRKETTAADAKYQRDAQMTSYRLASGEALDVRGLTDYIPGGED